MKKNEEKKIDKLLIDVSYIIIFSIIHSFCLPPWRNMRHKIDILLTFSVIYLNFIKKKNSKNEKQELASKFIPLFKSSNKLIISFNLNGCLSDRLNTVIATGMKTYFKIWKIVFVTLSSVIRQIAIYKAGIFTVYKAIDSVS